LRRIGRLGAAPLATRSFNQAGIPAMIGSMECVRRSTAALLLGLAAFLLLPLSGRAHADLAGEYLADHDVFLPVEAKIDAEAVARLATVVREAGRAGFDVKVAVITQPADLGSLSRLYGKPQAYARFLGLDLAAVYSGRVLVVMPNGFGYSVGGQSDQSARRVLTRLAAPGRDATKQTEAATLAVRRLAAARGHRLSVPRGGGQSESRDRLTVAAAATAGIALVAGLVLYRRQRRDRQPT